MKVESNSQPVSMSGTFQTASYNIKATGKAFRILSSGLYSDKILAIIRELSCNAYDSHVAAGKPTVPFIIHLPNGFEPFFSVKDIGLGLSHEDVYGREVQKVDPETGEAYIVIEDGLFRTYFDSTKTDSNEFVGALGLGSKSPFSYVDSYTVISVFNGKKRTYNAYIAAAGIPDITLLTTEETDEVNGLEIIIPVKHNDMRTFHEKCVPALKYFSVKPEFTAGLFTPEFRAEDVRMSNSNWKILDKAGRAPVAIMGGISYPIDKHSINDITPQEAMILTLPLELYFDIGDLDFAASREALSYDEPTINQLRNTLQKIYTHMRSGVEKDFSTSSTEWDARSRFAEHFSSNVWNPVSHAFGVLVDNDQLVIEWSGMPIKASFITIDRATLDEGTNIRQFAIKNGTTSAREVKNTSKYGVVSPDINILCRKNTHVVFDDMPRAGLGKMKWYTEKHKCTTVFITVKSIVVGDSKSVDHEIDKFKALLGNPSVFVRTSEIVVPTQVKEPCAGLFVLASRSSTRDGTAKAWKESWPENSGLYVPIKNFSVLDKNGNCSSFNFITLVNQLTQIGIINSETKIFGVRPRAMREVQKNEDFINLYDYATDEINEYIRRNKVADALVQKSTIDAISNQFNSMFSWKWETVLRKSILPNISEDSPINLMVEKYNKFKNIVDNFDASILKTVRDVMATIGVKFKYANAQDLKLEVLRVFNDYPMLGYVSMGSHEVDDTSFTDIATYISLIDNSPKV